MKKFKIYLSFLAVFALLFTSCSKDEQPGTNSDSEKATLSFGAIVEDLAAKSNTKQSAVGDLPACSDDEPAYVQIVLMQGDVEVVGTSGTPYRVDLVDGQIFTEEDPMLELDPGTYTLDHFAVYNEGGDLLWLAPKGGALAEFVDSPLPMNINLGAGVKKYVDVSVICYDNRDTNEYGYLFFELEAYEAFEYCVFANYCAPDGRHYPARYSVDVSIDGVTIYSGAVNNVGVNANGDFYADPLCGALPDLPQYADDEEYIDITLTLLDWDANYGDVGSIVIEESLSRNEIVANFDGDEGVFYEHFRFGCGDDDGEAPDTDNDGVPNNVDECPNEAGPATNEGCPVAQETDSDNDGVIDEVDQCEGTEAGVEVDEVGCPVADTDSDNDGVDNSVDQCENTPAGVGVDTVGCPIDSDSDGVPDYIDECDNLDPETDVDGDGCEDENNQVGCTNLPNACNIDTGLTLPENCYYADLDAANDGWVQVNSDSELNLIGGLTGDEDFGDVSVSLSGNVVSVTLDGELADDRITAYAIEVRPNEDDVMSSTCWESACDTEISEEGPVDPIVNSFDDFEYSYPIFIKVDIVNCGSPVGVPD